MYVMSLLKFNKTVQKLGAKSILNVANDGFYRAACNADAV